MSRWSQVALLVFLGGAAGAAYVEHAKAQGGASGYIAGAVARANDLVKAVHKLHQPFAPSSGSEYCRLIKAAYDALNELSQYEGAYNSARAAGSVPPDLNAASDAYGRLSDEMDEEEYENGDYTPIDDWYALPCPPRSSLFTGLYAGVAFVGDWGHIGITEFSRISGLQTNNFDERGNGVGAGFQLGYNFAPFSDHPNVRVGPFVSMDFYDQKLRHTFPAATYLGTASNWQMTVGAKMGMVVAPNTYLYGLGGASFLNEKVQINFGGPITDDTKTVPGGTVGLGFEYKLPIDALGMPLTIFGEYKHTWFSAAHLDAPTASTGFNYDFKTRDDAFRLGMNAYFGTASDVRLKRDIVFLQHLPNGVDLYRFRYMWSDQVYVGVMAQDVARVMPAAVISGPDHYLRVDYRRLGIQMQPWEDWSASRRPSAHAGIMETGNVSP